MKLKVPAQIGNGWCGVAAEDIAAFTDEVKKELNRNFILKLAFTLDVEEMADFLNDYVNEYDADVLRVVGAEALSFDELDGQYFIVDVTSEYDQLVEAAANYMCAYNWSII